MTASLTNFLLSVVAGLAIIAIGAGALTFISRIDRIR